MRKCLEKIVGNCSGGKIVGPFILGQPGGCLVKLTIHFSLGINVIEERHPGRGVTSIRSRRRWLGSEHRTVALPIAGRGTGYLREFRRAPNLAWSGLVGEKDGIFQLADSGRQVFKSASIDVASFSVGSGSGKTVSGSPPLLCRSKLEHEALERPSRCNRETYLMDGRDGF
jgi:hypothetical protein